MQRYRLYAEFKDKRAYITQYRRRAEAEIIKAQEERTNPHMTYVVQEVSVDTEPLLSVTHIYSGLKGLVDAAA